MSDLSGPKKETVRITLPPRVPPGGVGSGGSGTTKISLPVKLPGTAAESPKRVIPPPPPPSRRVPPPPPMRPQATVAALPPPVTPRVAPAVQPVAAATPAVLPMPPRPRVLPPPPRVLTPRTATGAVADAPAHYPGSGSQAGPRKETARITILPEPASPMTATVKMAKTQPLLTVPVAQTPSAPVIVAAESETEATATTSALDMLDHVPLPVCWTIFGISTVTLLIQIWNYFSS